MRSQTPGAWRRRIWGGRTRLDRAPGLRKKEDKRCCAHPVDVVNCNESSVVPQFALPLGAENPHNDFETHYCGDLT
jgi:hypothetical protein